MPFQGSKQQKRTGSANAAARILTDEDRAAGSAENKSAPPASSVTTQETDNTKTASGDDQSASDKAGAGSGFEDWASGSDDPDEQKDPPVSLYDKYMRDIANINTKKDWYAVNEQLTADANRGEQDAPYETLIDFLNMRMDEYWNIVPIANIQRAPSPGELAEIARPYQDYAFQIKNTNSSGTPASAASSVAHPYASHINKWNALKTDAASLGMTNAYGAPTQQYYSYKGKPQWMIEDDEVDRQRTLKQNPPMARDVYTDHPETPDQTYIQRDTNTSSGKAVELDPIVPDVNAAKNPLWDVYAAGTNKAQQANIPNITRAPSNNEMSAWALPMSDFNTRIRYAQTPEELDAIKDDITKAGHDSFAFWDSEVYQQLFVSAENKRRQIYQQVAAQYVNPQAALDAALKESQADYDSKKGQTLGDKYGTNRTPWWFAGKAHELGYTDEDIKEYVAKGPAGIWDIPAIPKDEYQQSLISGAGLKYMQDLQADQQLKLIRQAEQYGLTSTLSENVMSEYLNAKASGGYDASKEQLTKNTINGEIENWQSIYDKLASDEAYVKASGDQDAISEWEYRMAVTERNLAVAQAQLVFFADDFEGRVQAAQANTENEVSHPEVAKDREQYRKNDRELGYTANVDTDSKEIYNLADDMTDYEKQIYNYLYGDGSGQAEADAYFESIRDSVEARAEAKRQQEAREGDSTLGAVESVFNLSNVAVGTAMDSIFAAISGEDVSPYDPRFFQLRDYEQYRDQVLKAAPEELQAPLSAIFSIGDMGTAFVMGGGVSGMTAIMASEAGASTILETLDHGGDIQTAVLRGMGSALIEYATERLGTGERFMNLFANPKSAETFLKMFVKSFGAEAVEEVPGWLYGQITDDQIAGAMSAYNQALVAYGKEYSPEEAKKKAEQDGVTNLLNQMYAAGMAGSFGSSVANVAGNINANIAASNQAFAAMAPVSASEVAASWGMGPSQSQDQTVQDQQTPEYQADAGLIGTPDAENSDADAAPPMAYIPDPTPATASDGSSLDLVGFDTLGDNASVLLADGSTVPFSQVAVSDPSMAAMYEVAKTFEGTGEANAFIQLYQKSDLNVADFIDLYAEIYRKSIANKNSAATDAQDTGAGAQGMGTDGVPGMTADTQGTDPAAAPAAPFGQQDIAALGMPNLENLNLASINEKLQEAGFAPLTVDMDLYQEAPGALNPDDPLAQTDESDIMGEEDEVEIRADDAGDPAHLMSEGSGDEIDGIKIIDGKVGGKIPVDEFKAIRQSSIKNPDADTMTMGKYTNDASSYIQQAGTNSSYFDMGDDWNAVKQRYGLENKEMFEYFNKTAIDDAITKGKKIRFTHDPLEYGGSFLADEWEHVKDKLSIDDANLIYEGGFWYAR